MGFYCASFRYRAFYYSPHDGSICKIGTKFWIKRSCLTPSGLMPNLMFLNYFNEPLGNVFHIISTSAVYWLPIALLLIAWDLWLSYIRKESILNLKWTMLEVRLSRDIWKSPLAMEIVLANAFYQTGGVGTWYHKYWLGNVPIWFSLEIVSVEGNVKFFIRTQERFKTLIMAQIYSQYPQVEILEVGDYTSDVPKFVKDGEWNLFGTEFELTKADPYPIKTYVDYGLDRAIGSLDEEERIDPLTSVLELMGSLGQGEQFWIQILIRPANWGRYDDPESRFKKIKWQKLGENEIKKLKKDMQKPPEGKEQPLRPTKGELDVVSALERSIEKFGFDSGLRVIYLARKEVFGTRLGAMAPAITGVMRQFSSNTLNGFKVNGATITSFDYPWQDFSGRNLALRKHEILEAYRLRSYFNAPYKRKPFVLNTEELATIFHFPGRVSQTPTVGRIESKKSEPPANIPV